MNMRRFAYVALLALAATACASGSGADSGDGSTSSTSTTTAASTTTTSMPTEDDGHEDGGHEPGSEFRDVDPALAPSVSDLRVTEAGNGWLVTFTVTGHEFSEEARGTPHVDGQGHGHLYVDGIKVATIFRPSHIIEELPTGSHIISVTLNANDHATLAVAGTPIGAEVTVEVSEGVAPTATLTVQSGRPVGGIARIEVTQGDTVILEIVSDAADEVHVHGLDVYGQAEVGESLVMTFEASIAGIWEIELEGTHTQIAELVVNP